MYSRSRALVKREVELELEMTFSLDFTFDSDGPRQHNPAIRLSCSMIETKLSGGVTGDPAMCGLIVAVTGALQG